MKLLNEHKKKLQALDWKLTLCFFTLIIIGFSVQYSAAGGYFKPWAQHQMFIVAAMLPTLLFIIILDLDLFFKHAYTFFIITLALLITVKFLGIVKMGATRWINIFGFTIQPSEFAKISLILALSRYFKNITTQQGVIKLILLPMVISSLPIFFTLSQPSLGSAIIILLIASSIFFASGIEKKYFIWIIIGFFITIPLIWNSLHDYQKSRISIFLNPHKDPLGDGYNILQSKIAIGSGGTIGKGFLHGSQTQLMFLPEKHTDFAFAVFAEEHGFIKTIFLLLLYAYIIIKGLIIAQRSHNNFGKLVSIGSITFFSSHLIINSAMVTGLLPVVGIPLPLLSYGGSVMLISMACFGLLLNVDINNKIRP